MQLGIGTDIVRIERLHAWRSRSEQQLRKIFTKHELDDCRTHAGDYDPTKLAVRFAAKEAFYKALSLYLIQMQQSLPAVSFIRVVRAVSVVKDAHWQVPQLAVDWEFLENAFAYSLQDLYAAVSLAHDGEYAQAFVIIYSAK